MAKYRVSVDKDLQDIVPGYLEKRRLELSVFFAFHSAGDLESLRKGVHKLAGSGGGYGFSRLSELGKELEALCLAGDAKGIAARLFELKDYIENIEVVYE